MQATADEAGLIDRGGAALDATHVKARIAACLTSPANASSRRLAW
jgi:hypothetical protein